MISAELPEPRQHARFDWYAATVNADVDTLRATLAARLGASKVEPRDGAKNGYRNREVVLDSSGATLATILHGGNGGLPHAFASSDATDAFVDVVRSSWAGPTGRSTSVPKWLSLRLRIARSLWSLSFSPNSPVISSE